MTTIPVKEAAKRIRKAIKSHPDGKKLSVKMDRGTAYGYIDISGSADEFRNFTDEERSLLESYGMYPGGNFSCIPPEGRTFRVEKIESFVSIRDLVIEMETVKLKNDTEELKVLVQTTMIALENLVDTNPIAICELVEMCKDASHKPFGNTGNILEDLSLVNNGQVHTSIKNIVMSAFEGEGFDLHLTFPVVT